MNDESLLLHQVGQLYVTDGAARVYARIRFLPLEDARRELTEFLLEARRASAGSALWRRQTANLDVSACVAYDRRLVVVTAVAVHGGPRR